MDTFQVTIAVILFLIFIASFYLAKKGYQTIKNARSPVDQALRLGIELGIETERTRVKIEALKAEISRINLEALLHKNKPKKP